jgi:hypothetical protein
MQAGQHGRQPTRGPLLEPTEYLELEVDLEPACQTRLLASIPSGIFLSSTSVNHCVIRPRGCSGAQL